MVTHGRVTENGASRISPLPAQRGKEQGWGADTSSRLIAAEREANGPYRSLYDLLIRARLERREAEALIMAGALDCFGLPRRELLWQLGLMEVPLTERHAPAGAAQAPLPLPVAQDMAELPRLSPWQDVAWDYESLGTTARPHPMALVRPLLHEGMISSKQLGGVGNPNRMPQGASIEIAGMVVTRQRPQTASGVMFMLLEDEFGLANIVVYTPVQERQRELVRGTPFVIIRGHIDNEKSGFPNVIADRFFPCPLPGRIETPEGHNWG